MLRKPALAIALMAVAAACSPDAAGPASSELVLAQESEIIAHQVGERTGATHDRWIDRLLDTLKQEQVDFVQFNYSVSERNAEKQLLPYCADQGIATLINRPFTRGNLLSKVRDKPLPDWAAEIDASSWAQLLLKFILAESAVTAVIPATSNPRYMADNLLAGQAGILEIMVTGANVATPMINDNGDGIIITEKSGQDPGASPMRIEDVTGTVARSLRIAGEAAGTGDDNYIDGSYETVVELDPGDTLDKIVEKINKSGAGVSVLIAPVELSALTGYIESTFGQVAESKGLRFEIRRAEGVPRALETDSQRLQQIVRNLLSNAFKFTRRGTVTFEIALAESGWTHGHPRLDAADEVITFKVSDTGIGIRPDQMEHIFEAFQQSDEFTRREFGGTGLGLSITHELVRLLGGDITVQSSPGHGSVFTVYLPLERVDVEALESPRQAV